MNWYQSLFFSFLICFDFETFEKFWAFVETGNIVFSLKNSLNRLYNTGQWIVPKKYNMMFILI